MLAVLVVCTGNSARSQMAEALLATRGAGRVRAASCGARPAARVHPLAVAALAERGIVWKGRSPKGFAAVEGERWDLVLTVCDRAREACPIFPSATAMAHWGMPDPAEAEGTEAERLAAFRAALVALERRVDALLALSFAERDRRALAVAAVRIGVMA